MNEEGTNAESGAEARIRQLIADKKQMEAQIAELREKASAAEKWQAKYEEAQGTYKAEREAAALERQILSAGVTEEGIEYVQHAYGKLPADGRPPLAEWLANRDGLPKAVRAYLSEPAATTTPSAASAPAAAAPAAAPVQMPRSNAGAVQSAAPAATAWSAEAISKLSPAEFKANRDAIMASLLAP